MVQQLATLVLIFLMLTLAACSQCKPAIIKTPAVVEVPVEVKPDPPAELMRPLEFSVPVFFHPDVPDVTSALKKDGEINLKILINELLGRANAWKEWATTE